MYGWAQIVECNRSLYRYIWFWQFRSSGTYSLLICSPFSSTTLLNFSQSSSTSTLDSGHRARSSVNSNHMVDVCQRMTPIHPSNYHHHHWVPVVSRGWAKPSACRLQVTVFCCRSFPWGCRIVPSIRSFNIFYQTCFTFIGMLSITILIYTIILLKYAWLSVCRCSQTTDRNYCSIVSGDVSNCSYWLSFRSLTSSHLSSA